MYPAIRALAYLLAAVAACCFATPARADPLPGSTFEGDDADQAATALLSDWQSLYAAGRVTIQNDPNTNDSTINGKELQPDGWTLGTSAGGAAPAKNNVLSAWYATELRPAGNFIYFAFRRQSSAGDSYLAFIVNQRTDTWVNSQGAAIPCRTTGDVLISYSVNGGSAEVGLARWTSAEDDPVSGCSKRGTYTTIPLSGTNAQGAVNVASAITNFMPGDPVFSAGQFGEGALNLTDTLSYSCARYRQIQVHSRTSSSLEAALSDTADPVTVDLGGCDPAIAVSGPASIHHGEMATFTYTVTNEANTPLRDVAVTDDRCAAVTGPVKTSGDQDDVLVRGEVWTYTCSYVVTATHSGGEADPITSTATVTTGTGADTLTESAAHSMEVLHPQITLDQEIRRGAAGAFVQGPIEAHAGDTVHHRFTLTNPGDTPLAVTTGFAACDEGTTSGPAGDADGDGRLDPGETWVYLCRHVLTADDPFTSTATVTGADVGSGTATASDAATVDILNPAIAVTGGLRRGASGPYSDGPIQARAGDTLHYRFVVTNTGDAPLDVAASAAGCDAGTLGDDGDGTLDPGESWTYTCTRAVTSSDPDPLGNLFSVTGTDALGLARSASTTETADLLNPALTVDKELRLGAAGAYSQGPIEVHEGDVIGYRFTLVNTGDAALTYTIADPGCDAGTLAGGSGTLAPGATAVATCTRVVTAADPDPLPNRVDVTGSDALGGQATAFDTAYADVLSPGIAVDKTIRRGTSGAYVQGPIQALAGDTLGYRFAVTNTAGSEQAVTLDDPRCAAGTLTGPAGDADGDDRLDVTETWTYECTRTVAAGDADPFVNQVTVTGTDNLGGESVDIDAATADVLHAAVALESGVRVGGVGPYAATADAHVGDTATYLFTVTNPGDTPLSVALSTPQCDPGTRTGPLGDTDGDEQLAPSETWTFTCTRAITAALADPYAATAQATGTDDLGATAGATDATTVDVLHPAIALDQELRRGASGSFADGPIDVHRGDTIEYRFAVTNPGDTPLAATLTAPRCDTGTLTGDGDGSLAPGETWTYTCSRVVRAGDPDPLAAPATASGTDVLGGSAEASDSTTADVLHPAVALDKEVRREAGAYAQGPIDAHRGDDLGYRLTVTNTGDTPLAIDLSDPRCDAGTLTAPAGDSDGDGRLDLNETWVATCTHAVTAGDPDPLINTATASATDGLGGAATDSDGATVDLLHPRIAIDKQVRRGSEPFTDGPAYAHTGDTLDYRFAVTNAGDTPLTVSVADPGCDAGTLTGPAGDADGDGRLGTAETFVYACTHTVVDADGDPFQTTATATGTDVLGASDGDADAAGADVLDPAITLVQQLRRGTAGAYGDGPIDVHVGDTIGYRFTVANAGDAELEVTLDAARCAAGTLTGPAGDADEDGRLDLAETWTYECSRVVGAGDPDPLTATATATGTDLLGAAVAASDTVSADVLHPAVALDVQVRRGDAGAFEQGPVDARVGDDLHYRFVLTNPGDAPLSVTLDEDGCDAAPSAFTGDADGDGRLDPGETWTVTCVHRLLGTDPDPFTLTAGVTAADALGGEATGGDSASADVLAPGLDLLVEARVAGAFSSGPVDAHLGDTVTYRFTVTNDGETPLLLALDAPRCDAGTMGAPAGDADGDGRLDPDETWVQLCTEVVTAADGDPFAHAVSVLGTDALGGTDSAADAVGVDVLHPALTVDHVGPAEAHRGDTLDYGFTVTNTGDTPLELDLGAARCDAGTLGSAGSGPLAAGQSRAFTCTNQVGTADPDPLVSDVTVTGTDAIGGVATAQDSVTTDLLHPVVAVDAEVLEPEAHRGDTVTYRFTITNGGDAPLSVTLDAPRCDAGTLSAPAGDADGDGRLDPAETWVQTCTRVIAGTDPDPLVATVTATGADVLGGVAEATDAVEVDVLHPAIALAHEVSRDGGAFIGGPIDAHEGDTLSYRFTVTNPGDAPLAVALTAPACAAGSLTAWSGDADGDGRLDGAETWVATCTRVAGATDPLVSEPTVTGTDALGEAVEATDTVTVDVLHPAIALDEQVRRGAAAFGDGPVEAHRGDVLDHRFTVTNTGDTPLAVTLTDPRCDAAPSAFAGDADGDGRLDTTETWTATCSHTVTAADADPLTGTATATGTDVLGAAASDSDGSSADLLHPAITLDAQLRRGAAGAFVDGPIEVRPADVVTYRFTVGNPGDAPLAVTLDEPVCDAGTLGDPAGDADGDGRLDATETWTYTCTHVVAAGDPDPLETASTATGADALGRAVEAADGTSAAIVGPAIALSARQRRGSDAFTGDRIDVHEGDVVDYEFVLDNVGESVVTPQPTAPVCDAGSLELAGGDGDADGRLGVGETWTYTCRHEVLAHDGDPLVNRMDVLAADALGQEARANALVRADVLHPAISVAERMSTDRRTWTQSGIEVDAGATLHYRFEVVNSGDTPLDVTLTPERCDDGTLQLVDGDRNRDGGLDETEAWTYECRHLAQAAEATQIDNPVTVVGRDRIGGTATGSDNRSARVRPVADLELRKSAPASVAAGGDVAFTLVVVNHGPSTAHGVEIRDTLPGGLTFRSSDGDCAAAGGVVTCAIGTLLSGASAAVTVVAGTPATAGRVINTATVAGDEHDPVSANDSASAAVDLVADVPPAAPVDLVVDKSLLDAADRVGDRLTYLVTVINDGPDTAHGVTIFDTLSNAIRVVSVTPSQGSCDGAPALRCPVGDIPAGGKVTLRIVVIALREGALTNTASAYGAEADPNAANNVARVTRTIRPQLTRQTLTKRASRTSARSGQVVTFTITYRNRGRAAAQRVRVCDRLPAQLSFVSAPGARLRAGEACWTRARVAAGRTLRFVVRARVDSTVGGRAVNVATASALNAPAARARAAVRVLRRVARSGGVTG